MKLRHYILQYDGEYKMKTLHVMPYVPYPTSGALVRDYNIIKNLSLMGVDSQLVCNYISSDMPVDAGSLENQLNAKIHPLEIPDLSLLQKAICVFFKRMYPPVKRFDIVKNKNFIASYLQNNDFDILHAQHSVEAGPAIRASQVSNFEGCKILTLHNVDHLNFARQISHQKYPHMKFAYNRAAIGYKEYELSIIQKFDRIFVVSDIDRNIYISEGVPEHKVNVIPNGVDCSSFFPKCSTNNVLLKHPNILFMGKLSYRPNISGIKVYLENIHPLIKRRIPEIKFYIIGKDCPEWLLRYSKNEPSVEVIGFVQDVRPYIFNSDVCIAPLKSGSGTRLKILEYMAMGKPIVSTSIGAEGLDVKNGVNIFIADQWNAFAENIVKVIEDPSLARDIGNNARKLVEEKYDWKKIVETQYQIYQKLLSSN